MLHSQQNVAEIIRDLNYDFTHFNLNDFVCHIEARRRRPIVIEHWALDLDLFGIWIPADGVNYIFVNETLHPIHQVHSILHELAHILLQHPRYPLDQVLSVALLQRLCMHTAEGCARYAPSRQIMQTPEEQEAEAFVFQIQEQVIRAKRLQELTAVGSSIKTLRPLIDTSEA